MKYIIDFSLYDIMSILELSDGFQDDVEEVLNEFIANYSPEGGYKIYNKLSFDDSSFTLDDTVFNCGRKIAKALNGAESMAVVVATVGGKVEELIKKYNDEYDFLKAYWCDKLSNWTLYKVIDQIKNEISNECESKGYLITSHWGPGYCGWNISEQEKLLPFSIADELGISLSSSMLMHPVKSISGVIGIGENVVYKESGCSDCNLVKCAYRTVKW